ncbi:hypothetical protein CO608_10190 [Lysobacteraceae bacterium NML08-0793]|nr:hypothetical protein CO608_10190 [Xanthomonadaceae bacterium NML08-0793]
MNLQTPEEQLSALLDGELDADRSRFLLRRLQHDVALADTLGRWQLAGDVLRGRGSAAASASFAARLSARLAAEAAPDAHPVPTPQIVMPVSRPASQNVQKPVNQGRWRYFAGGAMAASLAFAAFIGLRLPEDTQLPEAPSSVATVAAPVARVAALPVAPVQADSLPAAQAVPAAQPTPATSALAQTQAARATPARRSRSASVAPIASESQKVQIAQNLEPRDPFSPPQARPAWPRAVLPGSGHSTFNVRLESGQPSGYSPFEPQPQNLQD